MRRKSERTVAKQAKSPEKKVDKVRKTRSRRRKQSNSSENESAEETPVQQPDIAVEVATNLAQVPAKEDSPEDSQDQVWQVKATEASGDVGEIQKLKICLKRPPSTPERPERSPRSKRKHSRATSSSDTPSNEGVEEKKKTKHRSRRSRESKDDHDKSDLTGEEVEGDHDVTTKSEGSENEAASGTQPIESDQIPMSTTNEDAKDEDKKVDDTDNLQSQKSDQFKATDADTTVKSPQIDAVDKHSTSKDESNSIVRDEGQATDVVNIDVPISVGKPLSGDECKSNENMAAEQAEAPLDNKVSKSDNENEVREEPQSTSKEECIISKDDTENCIIIETNSSIVTNIEDENVISIKVNASDVFDDSNSSTCIKNNEVKDEGGSANEDKSSDNKIIDISINLAHTSSAIKEEINKKDEDNDKKKQLEQTDTTQNITEENISNGQAAPIVVNRKRRWGSRPTKITTQKSITISTDILKEIIPDVKPVEFEEVMEEKKQSKRNDSLEKVERPLLPKIIIDNTENVEQHRRDHEDKEKENTKSNESHLGMNRKISIVKENESIIARPPSPPRNKQSNILYITNLVRPFTLPQLKNLLQRTGRIVENGFWIDKIKSRCFVQYENEDQAVETRHALHGVTWPVSNPKTLQVDFSTQEAFDKAKLNEDTENAQASTIPGTVEDWLREQDMKRERGDLEKPWERKAATREWDLGKNEKEKEKDKVRRDDRIIDKRRHHSVERSPEPAKKFKKKEEEAPAKLLDDLFRKTKTTPCIYWLPLSAETVKKPSIHTSCNKSR